MQSSALIDNCKSRTSGCCEYGVGDGHLCSKAGAPRAWTDRPWEQDR